MKKTLLLFSLMLTLPVTFVFNSCQKNSNSPSGGGTQDGAQLTASANADAEAEAAFNDATDNVIGVNDDAGIGTGVGVFGRSVTGKDDSIGTHCFKLSITPETIGVFPKTITIDFGSGCTGPDGHTRRGKITTVYSAPMRMAGSTATTTFDEYYVDDVHVEGAMTVENNSVNNDLVFSITVENGKLSKPDGDYIFYNKTKTWTRISGNNTPINITDDVYSISGKGNGTVQHGDTAVQWTAQITDPLIRKFTCRWIVAGTTQITRNNLTGTLDFGNGECDNKAVLNAYGKTYNIILP